MTKYKVEFDADSCIGTMQCLGEAAQVFKEDENGFTVLHNGKFNEATGMWELTVDEDQYLNVKDAEGSCPVDAIKVTKIE